MMNSFILLTGEKSDEMKQLLEIGLLSHWHLLFHSLGMYRGMPVSPAMRLMAIKFQRN